MRSANEVLTVTDAWMDAVEREFGPGWQAATLRRCASGMVGDLFGSPETTPQRVAELGHQLGREQIELGFASRCLQLLMHAAGPHLGAYLDSRAVAVCLADGWSEGFAEGMQPSASGVTPMPVFMQLLRQRQHRDVEPLALVVVDMQLLACSPLEQGRVRSGVLRVVRDVFSAGQPVGEGDNGNLVVMVDRSNDVLRLVAQLGDRIAADPALASQPLHVWVEPLATDTVHLDAHVAGLVGQAASIVIVDDDGLSRAGGPRDGDGPALPWPSKRPRSSRAPATTRRRRSTSQG